MFCRFRNVFFFCFFFFFNLTATKIWQDKNSYNKAPAKRSQHFNVRYRNIVGSNMLHTFDQHVATCCDVLRHVGCCWLKFETGQIFHAALVDVACCCSRLARFLQQCCPRACALVRFSTRNMSQHLATGWPNAATCCAQRCWKMLLRNVVIVWPGLENTGPIIIFIYYNYIY